MKLKSFLRTFVFALIWRIWYQKYHILSMYLYSRLKDNAFSVLTYYTVWKSTIKHYHPQKISWNQLFSNFFCKNVDLTEKSKCKNRDRIKIIPWNQVCFSNFFSKLLSRKFCKEAWWLISIIFKLRRRRKSNNIYYEINFVAMKHSINSKLISYSLSNSNANCFHKIFFRRGCYTNLNRRLLFEGKIMQAWGVKN